MAPKHVRQTQLPPHLPDAGVDVQEHAAARRAEHVAVHEKAHHVQEERGAMRGFDHLGLLATEYALATVVGERKRVGQAELVHHLQEVAQVDRPLDGCRVAIIGSGGTGRPTN